MANRLLTAWVGYWEPEPDESWWRWAEHSVTLTKYTPNPGPYSTSITPFAREWIECFRDPRIRETTLVTGSQVSKTQSCLIGLAATVAFRPIDCIWADPSREDAKSMSETRWHDIVEHSPLVDLKPEDSDRFKKLEQQFKRCTLTWVGAGSEAKLKSRPVGLLVLNEVEAWDAPTGHTHPAEEAEQRVKAYDGSKIVRNSTPKFAQGYIWQKFLQGDQRKYFVPCPHCGASITLEWKQVKWSDTARVNGIWDFAAAAASTYYECQECKGRILDHHKPVMLEAGQWRPTNAGADQSFRSYHLSSLYSPWRSTGFGVLACQFLKAKESLLGLQGFINGVLAEPWEQQQYVDPIAFPEGQYSIADVSADERSVGITADVQVDHFWAVVRGHGDGMFSRLHFAGRVESFDDLAALHRQYAVAPNFAGMDCGYDRNGDVYKFAAAHQWFALRGDDPREGFYRHILPDGSRMRRIYSPQERIDAHIGTAQHGFALRVFFAKSITDDILQQLLLRVRGDWQQPQDAPKVWLEQINARRKLPKRNPLTGDIRYEWVEVVNKWDHLRDAECMQVVLAAMRGMLREIEPGGGEQKAVAAVVVADGGTEAPAVAAAMESAEHLVGSPGRIRPAFVGRGMRRGFVKGW